MKASDVQLAVGAAMSSASAAGLRADDAVVLHDSDKLTVRLLPCDTVARIAYLGREVAEFEVELAQRLAETGSPVIALDPRVEPRVHVRDGFAITLWTYYEPASPGKIAPVDYANVLERLHVGMRRVTMSTPRFTDRVADAKSIVASPDRSPELTEDDREFLGNTLTSATRAIEDRRAPEQLLHGEPHLGNVLNTQSGLLFVDLETCCRGPVEFDIAHAVRVAGSDAGFDVDEVSEKYPDADQELVRQCFVLMLALITTWRWDRGDQLPNGRRLGVEWLGQLRRM